MGGAVDELERAVLEKKIKHGGHPVLRWNCSNAVVVLDPAGARKIAKDKSIGRVDGLVALAMALGLHAREPGAVEYDFTGEIVLTA
jgi:phage terminase large subunit-like protein